MFVHNSSHRTKGKQRGIWSLVREDNIAVYGIKPVRVLYIFCFLAKLRPKVENERIILTFMVGISHTRIAKGSEWALMTNE